MKRILALLFVLLLTLTACNRSSSKKLDFQTAQTYDIEDIDLPVEPGALYGSCTDGEAIYFLLCRDGWPTLYRTALEDGETEKLSEYTAIRDENDIYYSGFYGPFFGGDGKLWIWEQYTIPRSDRAERDEFCHLRQLDPRTGRELNVIDTGELVSSMGRAEKLLGLTVDAQETIYIGTNRKITALDGEGNVLFTLNAKAADDMDDTLALLPDGTAIALLENADGNCEVRSIDPIAKTWGEIRYNVTNSTHNLVSGGGPYQFFSQRNSILYGRLEDEALDSRLLRWEDAGLGTNPDIACFALLDGGRAAILTWEGSLQNGQPYLRILTPSNQLPGQGKIQLVYGTIGDDGWARSRVNQFNMSSDKYYIELRDYAEGMLDAHNTPNYNQIVESALKRLSAEIIAGRAPDILDDRHIPLSALARQGLLMDLWPFIDNDPELGRDKVMRHVLECAGQDGKLYRVFSNFQIATMTASTSITGDRTGWTLTEMQSACGGTIPEIYQLIGGNLTLNPVLLERGPDMLLWDLLWMDMGCFVDWETGECSFDTEAFQDILRLCAGQKTDSQKIRQLTLWNGEPVLLKQTIGCMADFTIADAAFGGPDALMDYETCLAENGITAYPTEVNGEWIGITDDWLAMVERAREDGKLISKEMAADFVSGALADGGYASYIGYPADGGSGSCFQVQDCLGIPETCKDKDGAWQFVRQLLLPDGNLTSHQAGLRTTYDAFPVNRADFEQLLEPEWFTDESGEYLLDQNGERIEKATGIFVLGDPGALLVFQRSPTQTQIHRFMTLYNSIDRVQDSDDDLLNMILEQAAPFFAGDKSAEETADLIQRRAALYVNENR